MSIKRCPNVKLQKVDDKTTVIRLELYYIVTLSQVRLKLTSLVNKGLWLIRDNLVLNILWQE